LWNSISKWITESKNQKLQSHISLLSHKQILSTPTHSGQKKLKCNFSFFAGNESHFIVCTPKNPTMWNNLFNATLFLPPNKDNANGGNNNNNNKPLPFTASFHLYNSACRLNWSSVVMLRSDSIRYPGIFSSWSASNAGRVFGPRATTTFQDLRLNARPRNNNNQGSSLLHSFGFNFALVNRNENETKWRAEDRLRERLEPVESWPTETQKPSQGSNSSCQPTTVVLP